MNQPSFVGLAVAATLSLVGAAQQVPVFRAGVDLVNLGVTVADRKGTLITDLIAADFEIYEDGKKQALRDFARGDRVQESGLPASRRRTSSKSTGRPAARLARIRSARETTLKGCPW